MRLHVLKLMNLEKTYSLIIIKFDPSWNPPYETWCFDTIPLEETDRYFAEIKQENGVEHQLFFTGTKEECKQYEREYNEQYDPDYERFEDDEVY